MPNVRLAFRALVKSPFVTLVAILSFSLGIGANAAIFSLFDQVLLRAPPVPAPAELVNLAAPVGITTPSMSSKGTSRNS